jgi:RND family efflux transporter MFP subunit
MTTFRWYHFVLILTVVVVLGGGGWYALTRTKHAAAGEAPAAGETAGGGAVTVEVVTPQAGGIRRVCVQPGTVEPFEYADLYAKASGFLVEQQVDISSRVTAGQVLARIAVPEYEKQVERDQARLRDARAKVVQMEAHLRAAQAEARAAEASVKLARVLVRAKTAFRNYRQKQRDRIKELVEAKALEGKLLDEQEDFYVSAVEAENAALEQVNTSQERAAASKAKVAQAEADVDEVKAEVGVAEAELARSQVLLEYTVIRSPYAGVVTRRNFHPGTAGRPGDFIKAADQGGLTPLLTVERTDLMRVVVQVPDRDVPYVSANSTVAVEIDALPGAVYDKAGTGPLHVARWADAEDPTTRTMRTEIDLPNPDGKLRHGMYGRVVITLAAGTPNALRVPSAALVGKSEGGRGTVRVVRDGKVHLTPVRFATDNGVEVEVVSGLSPTDRVVARATGPVEEGTAVTAHDESAPGH